MKNLVLISLAAAATLAAGGALAQASGFDEARSAPPGRGAVDDVNQNEVPDFVERRRWWPMSQYDFRRDGIPAYSVPDRRDDRDRNLERERRRDRDLDGVRNNQDRFPDDPRYR